MPQIQKGNKETISRVESKRFNRKVYQRVKKRSSRREEAERNQFKKRFINKEFGANFTYQDVINKWLPTNLSYILKCQKCEMNENNLSKEKVFRQAKPIIKKIVLYIPENFSLIDAPKECFSFLKEAILILLFGNYKEVFFSYKNCKKLDVGAQVILDIIKKESLTFIKKCKRYKYINRKSRAAKQVGITDTHYTNEEIQKILTSIGSLALYTAPR